MLPHSRSYLPKIHDTAVNILKFEPHGTMLASAAEDGTVCIWSMASQCVVTSCDLPVVATVLDWIQLPSSLQYNLIIGLNNGSLVRLGFTLEEERVHVP